MRESHIYKVSHNSCWQCVNQKPTAVLFPDIYGFYLREAVEQSDPPLTESPEGYLLSRLIAFFGKHLAYECKQRGCGMLLYRRGSDFGLCLAKSLKIFRSTDVSFLSLISADSKSESTNEAMLESVFMSMNECIRREISKITEADVISPYDISSFSVEKTVFPMIWKMVVLLTRTVTERKKNTAPITISV